MYLHTLKTIRKFVAINRNLLAVQFQSTKWLPVLLCCFVVQNWYIHDKVSYSLSSSEPNFVHFLFICLSVSSLDTFLCLFKIRTKWQNLPELSTKHHWVVWIQMKDHSPLQEEIIAKLLKYNGSSSRNTGPVSGWAMVVAQWVRVFTPQGEGWVFESQLGQT